jgi:hypothetical protein
MVCVDFCVAVAYCEWVGRRDCGVPGSPGRTLGVGFDERSEFRRALAPEASHWHNACSRSGAVARAYPEGFDITYCVGARSVGSRSECSTTGKNGAVLDLRGGVAEWQDLCTDNGSCRVLGGMFGVGAERGTCAQDATSSARAADRGVGFRCCLDLGP